MKRILTCLAWLMVLPSMALAQNALPPQPPRTVEGQPIETRSTEKADDKPLFEHLSPITPPSPSRSPPWSTICMSPGAWTSA
jgi:hypothetical protein